MSPQGDVRPFCVDGQKCEAMKLNTSDGNSDGDGGA
jgi:hypothetical protein